MREANQRIDRAHVIEQEWQKLPPVNDELALEMCNSALAITRSRIRGGEGEPYFKKPFCDAAFSENLFLWDTCFMACFAKYSLDELPIYQSLDNFYDLMDNDGYVCREYRKDGTPVWPKTHPVSINPPLLAYAERELFEASGDVNRIEEVFPYLEKNFDYHVEMLMHDDGLFHGDALGSGMDNIRRHAFDWQAPRGSGLEHARVVENANQRSFGDQQAWVEVFVEEYLQSKQAVFAESSRLVDLSAQMALFAKNLAYFAKQIGHEQKAASYESFRRDVGDAINHQCWNEEHGFYFDLGEGQQIHRKHIGMYWVLLADIVPKDRLQQFTTHLIDPNCFYRRVPLCALSADEPDYRGWGDYWLGGVWPPTVYMVLTGLCLQNEGDLARLLARKVYDAVAEVYIATGTFWENYAPDLISYGIPSKRECGWSAILPINLYNEFIRGSK